MNPGDLKERITIYLIKASSDIPVVDDFGDVIGYDTGFGDNPESVSVYAKLEKYSSKVVTTNGMEQTVKSPVLLVRHREDLTEQCIVFWNNDRYRIAAIEPVVYKQYVRLHLEGINQ